MNYENQHSPQQQTIAVQPLLPTVPLAGVVAAAAGAAVAPPPLNRAALYSEKTTLPPPSTNQHLRDDGSSGYGSPDSETFDAPCN